MAHDLFNASMMYVGEVPWHGLGTKLPQNATWEEIQSILPFYDALERPLFIPGCLTPVPDRKALIASNDGRYLATVGSGYGVVQFSQMAKVVAEALNGQAVFHTAGLMGDNGATGWLLGEIPNLIKVDNDDSPIRQFFLATSAHDGTSSVRLKNCATRVVCRNTLGAALGEDGASTNIRHTTNAALRVDAAGVAFKGLISSMQRFGTLANRMAGTLVTAEQRKAILEETFPMPEGAEKGSVGYTRTIDRRDQTNRLADYGQGIGPAMRGTAWALFQGVTEYADHVMPIRGNDRPTIADTFGAQIFGKASDVKVAGLNAIKSTLQLA